jgi:geranylgeranyl transferase type-1 subunit beta
MLGEDKTKLVNAKAIRRFLFEQTQHRIGGFGKYPGNPPGSFITLFPNSDSNHAADIYHSYLGLAALAVMKEPGIKPLDSALCVSKQQRERMTQQRETASVARKIYWKHGYPISIREDNPEFKEKMASSEGPPKNS